ncbi:hypothetical protein LGV83_11710 [Enterococcus durans]|nr:hypothetical protein [Enterococcus durans]MCA6743566.1 hypothetical protein [Enterococcus durans]MCG3448671.1 hypothetical protein [Enterococcus durans]MCJ2170484.1 hypothetical protein [Enterococcus durans]MCM6856683.1 hypothetical protein [Enterococcus durans]MCT4340875.1 hypothetical protein [Enterococcus durans]
MNKRKKWKKDEVGTEVFISEGVASAPTVYSFLKNETKVFLTFVPRSSFLSCSFCLFGYFKVAIDTWIRNI